MQSNSLGIYPFPCILYKPICSTTRQCRGFGSRIKLSSFSLSLHQDTKDKGKITGLNAEKSLKKGDTHLLKLLIIMYTLHPSCSVVYHVPCTLHSCRPNCVTRSECVSLKLYTCCLFRAYAALQIANNGRLSAVHV